MLEIYLTLKNQMKNTLKSNDSNLILSNIPLLLNFEKLQGTKEFEHLIED